MYDPRQIQMGFGAATGNTHAVLEFVQRVRRRCLHVHPTLCNDMLDSGTVYDVLRENLPHVIIHLTNPQTLTPLLEHIGTVLAAQCVTTDALGSIFYAFRATIEEELTARGHWSNSTRLQWESCCTILIRGIVSGMTVANLPPDPPPRAA